METRTCQWCGKPLAAQTMGRPKRFCSDAHRKASSRSVFPLAMRERVAWVRADGKRPIQVDGSPASSTDRGTWARLSEVRSGAGDGFGVMLGQGLGCYDLDDVTDVQARAFVGRIVEPIIYAERSASGRGVHIFVEAPESKGSRTEVDGVSVERYTRARFIKTTGAIFRLD